jgi:hypothetical protein
MPYNPDDLVNARFRAVLTQGGRAAEIIRITAQWFHPTTDSDPADLEKRAEEFVWMATLLLVGTRPGRKPRIDFFLMHVVTVSIFIPTVLKFIPTHASRIAFLKEFLPVIIMYIIARGRPRIDAKGIMTYTATPRPPLDKTTLPAPDPHSLGDPRDDDFLSPWFGIVAGSLYSPESHTVKAVRALYHAARKYGLTRPGEIPGAFRDAEGKRVETHEGIGGVDGTVFVRAAGLVMGSLGWVGYGDKEGKWDRTAHGWDDAWKLGED